MTILNWAFITLSSKMKREIFLKKIAKYVLMEILVHSCSSSPHLDLRKTHFLWNES